jgi:hypothetical protein
MKLPLYNTSESNKNAEAFKSNTKGGHESKVSSILSRLPVYPNLP